MATGGSVSANDSTEERTEKLDADDKEYGFPYCIDVSIHYEQISKIGQGTFG